MASIAVSCCTLAGCTGCKDTGSTIGDSKERPVDAAVLSVRVAQCLLFCYERWPVFVPLFHTQQSVVVQQTLLLSVGSFLGQHVPVSLRLLQQSRWEFSTKVLTIWL